MITDLISKLKRICIAAMVLSMMVTSTRAYAASHTIYNNGYNGIYIDIDSGYYKQYAGIANWGQYAYTTSGCAWFASARVRELTGKGTTIWSGSSWWSNYSSCGFSRGTTLDRSQRALACWSNHVAVIEGYTSDGKIIVSEGGVSHLSYVTSANGYCHITTFSTEANLKKESSSSFYGYVYLGPINPGPVTVSFGDSGRQSVGLTNANLAKIISVQNTSISSVSTVGIELYNSNGTRIGYKTETPISSNGVIDCWYDVNSELSCTLSPGTTYRFHFLAVVNGKTYYSSDYSFVTESLVWSEYNKHSIGTTNAVLARTLSINGSTSISCVSTVGIELYNSSGSRIGYKTETPVSSNTVINIWYDCNSELGVTLTPGAYYTYHFIAVVNGVTCYSPTYSFGHINIPVNSITLNTNALSLDISNRNALTGNLTATVSPSNATNKNVVWTSNNTSVATVSGGAVRAVGKGIATITCSAADGGGAAATCQVTVNQSVNSITLNRSTLKMCREGVGSRVRLQATCLPASADLTWTSSNENVVTVTQNGVLSAVGTGTATVTVVAGIGPSASCEVTVVSGMKRLVLPAELSRIEDEAFIGTNAEIIILPEGIREIGAGAFADSSQLWYVVMPESVQVIDTDAFANCPNVFILSSINSIAGNE